MDGKNWMVARSQQSDANFIECLSEPCAPEANSSSRSALRTPTPFRLDEALAKRIFGPAPRRTYPKGSCIVYAGDTARTFYLVLSGKIKISLPDEAGKEYTLSMLGPGDHFGELTVLDGQPRSASAVATERTTLLAVSGEQFLAGIARHPELAQRILLDLAHRLRAANRALGDLAQHDLYSRVTRVLNELSVARDGLRLIDQRLTHQQLASLVGASREAVTRTLRALVCDGYIAVVKHHIVLLKPLPQRR